MRKRRYTQVYMALQALGEPTHYSYIASKVNSMFPDSDPFTARNVQAAMFGHDDIFVSLGRGMYALCDWGVRRPLYIKDFVVETMRQAGGRATVDQVAALGAEKYGFKRSSIEMTLALNPTYFRRVGDGRYTLV